MIGWARRTLVIALGVGAISALAGGVLGTIFNGAGVPVDYLRGTPFTSYLIPGLILGIVIGGTQGIGALAVHRHHRHSRIAAVVAGFGMIIWLFVELAITGYSWLQSVYLALAFAEVLLVLILDGPLNRDSSPHR